jgi:predicted nucleic acid-binding protein
VSHPPTQGRECGPPPGVRRLLREDHSEILTLTTPVLDRATEIRARFNFKTPDAIHLAAAVENGCDAFLTNDQRLSRFPGIAIEVV